MPNSIARVLVANRAAIARRVVRACNEMGIDTVAVYSDADIGAPHLMEASHAVHLPGMQAGDTYLNRDLLIDVAKASNCDAVHPGYGFLAEDAPFARAVEQTGMVFIGPKPDQLEAMGDKVNARSVFTEQGFPVFPGSKLLVDDEAALDAAEHIRYPVLVKPAGGGGGMGMEVVADAEGLVDALGRARAIAGAAFGNSGVYLEKYITAPRHIEFQIAADSAGHAVHLFERECSVQRRNQKLIEESPAPGIAAEQVSALADQAAQVLTNLKYTNVGTLETLFAADGSVGFLEMNTRIQVEHGVTEAITGLDLVKLQIELAAGGELPERIERQGFAIEARIYAEDPVTMLPSTGRLSRFQPPHLHGVRIETGYAAGQTITPYYDAMLAKVIAHAHTRELAIGRLLVALKSFAITGVTTNQALLLRVLSDRDFLAGRVDTHIVERILNNG